ncbi:T7SS effector LXG polymorphic toxin [Listeria booriae]|uniref:T7SS effector LXG polymorphic toxin n=1 Tax=Listeria booriae TaxID=1552123 RepID=UPI001625CDA6|nr:T7SS effector LXG polymorphic toxin [Listeria booriae]MBC1504087.1 hypothetical protein [Listeria booriae]
MSVDMYVSESESQATSVSNMSQQQIKGYEQLQKAIGDFALHSPLLTGQAYDSAKAYFTAVLHPLAQGGILLAEAVEQAVKKFPQEYISQVDSGDLKQSELEEQIRQADSLIAQAEDVGKQLQSSKTPDIIKFFQLSANTTMIGLYSNIKKELEEKLRKLMDFQTSSPAIFSDIASLKQEIDQGLVQTKTAWNPSTGLFVVPSSQDLSWAKQINTMYLDKKMQTILNKIPKLSNDDMAVILEFAKNNPDVEVPESLIDYLKENKDDIIADIKNDALSGFIEQLGVGIIRFSGIINVLEGTMGPAIKNTFIMIKKNGIGSQLMKYGKNIATFGKVLGYGFAAVGFGLGMYDDMNDKGKTVGQAISHNAVSTGIGIGSGFLGAAAVGLLVSNPGGWAVLGGIAVGTIVSVGFNYLYDNNILHIQDGLDWVGDKIDEGVSWAKDRIQDAGEALSDLGESINPMNWAW